MYLTWNLFLSPDYHKQYDLLNPAYKQKHESIQMDRQTKGQEGIPPITIIQYQLKSPHNPNMAIIGVSCMLYGAYKKKTKILEIISPPLVPSNC